ncbi:unnamed protein product [Rotaria sp. Silwood2]|nr:unnamed protein product [Rotaria sp. Silwood2]CAF2733822.1 unnamed protein product [Rotaria sp. Silwood2]CAF3149690.1 unnamed protein product [Rotaria sp. Silwood2]CAF3905773.1 unnamed protein product [Rotaria sp. Silwood2]CAF3927535.1 unnamed protein product [Rotaria sp. Silwood2]
MSTDETNSKLDEISAAVRAATKLSNEAKKPEELTLNMLASAIKLAALPTDDEEKLTPAAINAAIKLSAKSSGQEEQHENLTPESLSIALKLATKLSSTNDKNETELSVNQMRAAMKASVAMTQGNESNELVTSELLTDALKLAKN